MTATTDESILYSIQQGSTGDALVIHEVATPSTITATYTSLVPVTVDGRVCLLGYDSSADHLDLCQFAESAPWLTALSPRPQVGDGHDIVEPFVVGNLPYVAFYTAKDGLFSVYAIANDLSLSKPYEFLRYHEPGITQGFTMLKSFTSFGQPVFLGYNGTNGYAALFTVSVTATSPPDVPPLHLTAVLSHMWAQGWTRFAFFQFGGENFFLKTNTWKPNVNIDHVLDDLAAGTAEVGSYLTLANAQRLDIVQPFSLGHGDPYFVSYMRSNGQLTLNRFHSDCLGWTTVASLTSKVGAAHVVPVQTADNSLFLLVQ